MASRGKGVRGRAPMTRRRQHPQIQSRSTQPSLLRLFVRHCTHPASSSLSSLLYSYPVTTLPSHAYPRSDLHEVDLKAADADDDLEA